MFRMKKVRPKVLRDSTSRSGFLQLFLSDVLLPGSIGFHCLNLQMSSGPAARLPVCPYSCIRLIIGHVALADIRAAQFQVYAQSP